MHFFWSLEWESGDGLKANNNKAGFTYRILAADIFHANTATVEQEAALSRSSKHHSSFSFCLPELNGCTTYLSRNPPSHPATHGHTHTHAHTQISAPHWKGMWQLFDDLSPFDVRSAASGRRAGQTKASSVLSGVKIWL